MLRRRAVRRSSVLCGCARSVPLAVVVAGVSVPVRFAVGGRSDGVVTEFGAGEAGRWPQSVRPRRCRRGRARGPLRGRRGCRPPRDRHARSEVLLQLVHLGEGAARGEQVVESALLGNAAAIKDDDAVRDAGVGQAVADEDGGAAGGEGLEPGVDAVFGAGVHGCGGFVEDQDGCVAVEGTGDGDALPLAAGQVVAAPPGAGERGVQAVRECGDDGVGAGGGRRGVHRGVAVGVGLAEGDVLAGGQGPAGVGLRYAG